MLITNLFKHEQGQWKTKFAIKLGSLCFQDYVGYCSVCKALRGTNFARNLISDKLYFDLYLEL